MKICKWNLRYAQIYVLIRHYLMERRLSGARRSYKWTKNFTAKWIKLGYNCWIFDQKKNFKLRHEHQQNLNNFINGLLAIHKLISYAGFLQLFVSISLLSTKITIRNNTKASLQPPRSKSVYERRIDNPWLFGMTETVS